jgi:uncharacterized protein YndB with AHSA1/START domain
MTKDQLIYTTFIKATPEKLWNAITNPEFSRQYWGGHANVSDWKTGATWTHEDTNDKNAVRVTGKVLEASPHTRLVISWFSPKDEADISRVTFQIAMAADDLVRLDVTHEDFIEGSVMRQGVSNGWPLVLASMKTYLETGTGIDVMKVFSKSGCSAKDQAA